MDTFYRFDGYEIIEELGVGATATVYKARDVHLNRLVALKVIHKELTKNEEFLKRFYQEARIIATIDHPAIVKIYHINPDSERPYLIEELVEGKNLKEIITERSPVFPDEIALFVLFRIVSGLKEVHRKGIIHRDLKPENILIGNDGSVKIVDFGLAHLPGVERLTISGMLLGSLAYASPEQIRGEQITPASDIFSLGVVFYQFITGVHPFDDSMNGEITALINSILNKRAEPISNLIPYVSPGVEKIILKMLEQDPENRYRDAGELFDEIEEYLKKTGVRWEKWYEAWLEGKEEPEREKENFIAFLRYQLRISTNPIDRKELIAKLEKLGYRVGWLEKTFVSLRRPILTFAMILVFLLIFFVFPDTLNRYATHMNFFGRMGIGNLINQSKTRKKNTIVGKVKEKPVRKSVEKQSKPSGQKKKVIKKMPVNRQKEVVEKNGFLKIVTFPWAEIYVDGSYMGKTPFVQVLKLKPGKHEIELKNPFTLPVTYQVEIPPGKTIEKRFRLDFLPSYIKITGGPYDSIWINERKIEDYEGSWIRTTRNVKIRVTREGKEKTCFFRLLPGEKKVVSCSP